MEEVRGSSPLLPTKKKTETKSVFISLTKGREPLKGVRKFAFGKPDEVRHT